MEQQQPKRYDAVIVGGGLAGLSAAAQLAKKGKKVALLEKTNLGGRAITINLKGFAFNFGAHAIYGRDTSVLKTLEKELGLRIDWRDFHPDKAKYDLGSDLTDVPANVQGLFRTKMLTGGNKIKFAFEVLKTLLHLESGHPHLSIKQWLKEKQVGKEVEEMMLTLAGSNFFTKEPDKIPSDVFFAYYKRIFSTHKPVAYIGGGWQALIGELSRVFGECGGEIFTKSKAESVVWDGDKISAVNTPQGAFEADEFIFCVPPKELDAIFKGSKIEHYLSQYAAYDPTVVVVYDIGLKSRVESPYTYIYDKRNGIFITDISYYDTTCVPEGGQLLQAIAYLRRSDVGNKEIFEKYKTRIEDLYDKHFAGWREHLVVPRVSQRAVVQEIAWNMRQSALPVFFPDYRNAFFAGDWCQGQGQLSELSFSSAHEACKLILRKGQQN